MNLRRPLLLRLTTSVVAAAWLTWSPPARAGGDRKAPNLRRDPKVIKLDRRQAMLVPLTIHVARGRESRAETMHRIRLAVARANEALEPHGLTAVVHKVWIMPSGYSEITSRRAHRRLADYAPVDGTVHVFLVDRLELGSVFAKDRGVRGMHWRYRGLSKRLQGRQYVVVNVDAPSTTLVHELGHLFGLGHDRGRHNLMCSCRRGVQYFSVSQGFVMRREARSYFRDGLRIGIR